MLKCVSVPCCAEMGKKARPQPPRTPPAQPTADGTAPTAADTSAAPPTTSHAAAAHAPSSSRPRKAGSAFSFGRALGGAGARGAQTPDPPEWQRRAAQRFVDWLRGLTESELPLVNDLLRSFDASLNYANWDPLTPKLAAAMQTQADQLTQQGETYKAHPLLCQLAVSSLETRGFDHAESVRAVYNVVRSTHTHKDVREDIQMWLLPRAVQHFGIDSPDTLWLVQLAATCLYRAYDPRDFTAFTQLVTDIAQQLPNGLGWGSTVVAPVPDVDTYSRHAVMQQHAFKLFGQGQYALAEDAYEPCLAYYETLGAHWLASPRKYWCMHIIGMCVGDMGDRVGAAPGTG